MLALPDRTRPRTQRGLGRLFTLIVIGLLAALFRVTGPAPTTAGDTMLLGFLLLAAFVAGELARELRLPRITGYLVIGLLFGPYVLGLLPEATVDNFRLINGIALSVIALQAGAELRLQKIRERLRSITTIMTIQMVVTFIGIVATVFLASDLIPFLVGQPDRTALAVALIVGVVGVTMSPATTIAVITDVHARGHLTDVALGVTILVDVIVLLLIAAVIPGAAVILDPGRAFDFTALTEIGLAILGSLVLGAAAGWIIGAYLQRIGRQPVLFVFAVAFVIVELAEMIGLEYILVSMAAGFVIQNFSAQGSVLVDALESIALPLYALFFAVAGAALDLKVIPSVWRVGLLLIVVRAVLIYGAARFGAALVQDPPEIRRHAWTAFLSQAGVALGLAHIVQLRFAPWGDEVAAVIIAMIAVNQLVGPPLFRFALDTAGETAAADRSPVAATAG